MDAKEKVRKQVWVQLRKVARPDSRFHWDFSEFIPDFENSETCTERICQTEDYKNARYLFVTPDNSLIPFRTRSLIDKKTLIVPTYGIGRGFVQVGPSDVPPGLVEFAATLDGMDRYARPYPVFQTDPQNVPDLIVTGASVLNREGVRISQGPSFFDLEWLILDFLGLITEQTPVITAVHDCQIVDWHFDPLPFSIVTDLIITPTTILETGGQYPRPAPSTLRQLPWHIVQEVPLLREILQEPGGPLTQ